MERIINRLYFGSYFFQAVFSAFVKWYLPVYFVIAAGLSGAEISVIVSLGMLPTVMKPVFGALIDKIGVKNQHRKPYIIMGYVIFMTAFIPFGLINLKANILLAAVLFLLTHSGQALIDTSIDAIALDNNRLSSGKALTFFALGSNLGGFVMMIIYFTVIQENIATGWWFGAYLCIIFCGLPLFLTALYYSDPPTWSPIKAPEILSSQIEYTVSSKMKKLVVVFLFFMNSFALGEFLIEPYIVSNHGTRAFSLYTVIVYTVAIAGIPLLWLLYTHREKALYIKGKLILIVGGFSVVYLTALLLNDLTLILAVSAILVILGVVQNFALMGILMAACPDKKRSMWYQLFAFLFAAFVLFWSSIGPILADSFGIHAVLYLIMVLYLPLLYILPSIDTEYKKMTKPMQ